MAIADRIVVMNSGRIEDQGSPARIYLHPATLFAAGFMGEMNRIPARSSGTGLETPLGRIALDAPGPGDFVLCLRPEAIRRGEGGFEIGRAEVLEAAFFGTHCRVHLRPQAAPHLILVAHLPPAGLPETGACLTLSAAVEDLRIFPKED